MMVETEICTNAIPSALGGTEMQFGTNALDPFHTRVSRWCFTVDVCIKKYLHIYIHECMHR